MKKLLLFISLLSTSLLGCKKDPSITIMQVNSYTQKCYGVDEMNCMLVQMDGDIGKDEWEYFYGGIEGFQYEEGYIYRLQVHKEQVKNPPADGSSIRYILVNILSKTKVTK
ncbi:DUF4377 domain-containing protein [Desertivirga brevis]|uniref:DUF4377 domain-containing protein n=1 Tax=Desertivirga brevis TaxID=2810310 RepID=UPI001A969C07|nr:DUF4377 domain-containing protein [Pedobacter sp. SYSU D00873]